jgi:chemotaxis protein MotA
VAQNPSGETGVKRGLDIGVYIGIAGGLAAVISGYIVEQLQGGSTTDEIPGALIKLANAPAFLIVIVGTLMCLVTTFPMQTLLNAPKYFRKAFSREEVDPLQAVQTFVRLADRARREGILSLEEEASQLEDEFMRDGIQEVVDGTPPEQISDLLEIRVAQMEARHREGFSLFKNGGGFSPTMGIIGTVMGLIAVLGHLGTSGPEALGASIAVAFLATLYGIAAANLFWLPLEQRLRKKSEEEVSHKRMILEGIMAIQQGDPPRLVRTKLEGFLSPVDRRRLAQAAEAGGGVGMPALAGAR